MGVESRLLQHHRLHALDFGDCPDLVMLVILGLDQLFNRLEQ